jgi:hypothetical protein
MLGADASLAFYINIFITIEANDLAFVEGVMIIWSIFKIVIVNQSLNVDAVSTLLDRFLVPLPMVEYDCFTATARLML